jgi:CBS domain-containing protein
MIQETIHGQGDAPVSEPEHAAAAAEAVRLAPPVLVGTIETVTRARLFTVGTDTLLAEVAAMLLKTHIGLVVVCDVAGCVAGVINETVLISQLAFGNADVFKTRASEVMLGNYTTCHASDSLADLLAKMQTKELTEVLVVNVGDMPLGVLNVRDGLRALLAAGSQEEALLRDYVMGVGYQ